ncbi:hypothetical protein C0Q70_19288 [Pomacea canaliculata]|uniref:Uncharacterized protein n=1 Tax=Pomacea canaliculata TaxID=400727 RepID=A0A2T7NIZ3_POMCA|nr:hypothetical protein C0Q70_19288 [Pomacea canaliculata]
MLADEPQQRASSDSYLLMCVQRCEPGLSVVECKLPTDQQAGSRIARRPTPWQRTSRQRWNPGCVAMARRLRTSFRLVSFRNLYGRSWVVRSRDAKGSTMGEQKGVCPCS